MTHEQEKQSRDERLLGYLAEHAPADLQGYKPIVSFMTVDEVAGLYAYLKSPMAKRVAQIYRVKGKEEGKSESLAIMFAFLTSEHTARYWKSHKAVYDALQKAFTAEWGRYANEPYTQIAQNVVTNALAALPRNAVQLMLDSPDGVASIGKGDKKIDFLFRDAAENGALKTQDDMLLDVLLREFQKTKQPMTTLPLEDYMNLRGKKVTTANKKEMREEVLASLERLQNIGVTFNEKVKGVYYKRGNLKLNGGTALIKNSVIYWNWNDTFMESLKRLPPMDYATETLLADPRTNVYYFSRFLDAHARRNEGKGNENIVTVAKLLEVARNLQTIEEVRKTKHSPKDRIIDKFFEDLDKIDRLLYMVIDKDGNELQPENIEDYETFIGCRIVFDLQDHPMNEERIAARKKREQATEKAKKKKAR